MEASRILLDNHKCKEGSFIYHLHELSEFSEEAYWEYYNAIVETTKITKNNDNMSRKTLDLVCNTYDFIIRSLMYHYMPDDLYTVSKLPLEVQPYIERLEYAFHGFLNGQIYDESIFELQNPTLSQS